MKKIFLFLATVAMVAMTAMTFAACGSDDDNEDPEPQTATGKATEAMLTQSLVVNADLLDHYFVVAVCPDGKGGETSTELKAADAKEYATKSGKTISAVTFEKTVRGSLPIETDMRVEFAIKDRPSEKYDIYVLVESKASLLDASGKEVAMRSHGNKKDMKGASPDRLPETVNTLLQTFKSNPIKVDAEGTVEF